MERQAERRTKSAVFFRQTAYLLVLLLAVVAAATGSRSSSEQAQQTIASAQWSTERLAPGVALKQCLFNDLFDSRQSVAVLEADLACEALRIRFPLVRKGRQKTSEMAQAASALAAVNGSFFSMPEGGASCFLRAEGEPIAKGGVRLVGAQPEGALAIDAEERTAILDEPEAGWPSLDANWVHVMAAGPMLLRDGKRVEQSVEQGKRTFARNRHPRTAAGLSADGRLILVTVDGRLGRAAGMSLDELTLTMEALGCQTALNLDGGGSTTMWVRGKPEGGIVNHPSDNKRFDRAGERPVSNAIAIVLAEDRSTTAGAPTASPTISLRRPSEPTATTTSP